jgi:hypothetical protein
MSDLLFLLRKTLKKLIDFYENTQKTVLELYLFHFETSQEIELSLQEYTIIQMRIQ